MKSQRCEAKPPRGGERRRGQKTLPGTPGAGGDPTMPSQTVHLAGKASAPSRTHACRDPAADHPDLPAVRAACPTEDHEARR